MDTFTYLSQLQVPHTREPWNLQDSSVGLLKRKENITSVHRENKSLYSSGLPFVMYSYIHREAPGLAPHCQILAEGETDWKGREKTSVIQ